MQKTAVVEERKEQKQQEVKTVIQMINDFYNNRD